MRYWAVIDSDGKVLNCIVAETKEVAEQVTGLTCVEYFLPTPGDTFDGDKFIYAPKESNGDPVIIP